MENRINVAKLLKDCPKGMELDCIMYGVVKIEDINLNDKSYPISIETKSGFRTKLTKYGQNVSLEEAECVIFPKGKTTWEGFQRPIVDGDILSYQHVGFKNRTIYIYMYHNRMNTTYYVALSGYSGSEFLINYQEGYALNSYNDTVRLATEEERQKLFKAIKDNGFRWNAETKTLEKLVNPNFKVGNKIIRKGRKGIDYPIEVLAIENGRYKLPAMSMPIDSQDEWELVSDKFDITTLKPFESRVLVRNADGYLWKPAIYGFSYSKMCYVVGGLHWVQCIPYEENKHLIGTTDDCSDFYKTWE
jgi:hypothetical protein